MNLARKILCTFLVKTAIISCFGLSPVQIDGRQFVVDGKRFIVKGLAYQPTVNGQFVDYISDENEANWSLDLPFFEQLGVNVLRVYETDPTKSHDKFMQAAETRGIYLLFDLPSSQEQNHINRKAPSYTADYLEYIQNKINHFSVYTNTFAYLIGNEVANEAGTITSADTFVKASLRDAKRFAKTLPRVIPIGYAAADVTPIRTQQAAFWACGENDDEKADFYSLNVYSWCGSSATFETSGYADRIHEFHNYPLPVFFAEYGCNIVRPRVFPEISAIYGNDMLSVFSGGILYEYSEEQNQYGLVTIDSTVRKPLTDFSNFDRALDMADFNPPRVGPAKSIDCPVIDDNWKASRRLPATPSSDFCACVISSLHCRFKAVHHSEKHADYGELLDTACGLLKQLNPAGCTEIAPGNGTSGEYGLYSGCTAEQKLSIVYDKYSKVSQHPNSCDFGGTAEYHASAANVQSCELVSSNGAFETVDYHLIILALLCFF